MKQNVMPINQNLVWFSSWFTNTSHPVCVKLLWRKTHPCFSKRARRFLFSFLLLLFFILNITNKKEIHSKETHLIDPLAMFCVTFISPQLTDADAVDYKEMEILLQQTRGQIKHPTEGQASKLMKSQPTPTINMKLNDSNNFCITKISRIFSLLIRIWP